MKKVPQSGGFLSPMEEGCEMKTHARPTTGEKAGPKKKKVIEGPQRDPNLKEQPFPRGHRIC